MIQREPVSHSAAPVVPGQEDAIPARASATPMRSRAIVRLLYPAWSGRSVAGAESP